LRGGKKGGRLHQKKLLNTGETTHAARGGRGYPSTLEEKKKHASDHVKTPFRAAKPKSNFTAGGETKTHKTEANGVHTDDGKGVKETPGGTANPKRRLSIPSPPGGFVLVRADAGKKLN